MEQFDLTNPEITPAIQNNSYRIVFISLEWEVPLIVIRLRSAIGGLKTFTYGGSDSSPAAKLKATNLMIGLNKANLSVKSLQRRILEQLVTDGLLVGTISGSPD